MILPATSALPMEESFEGLTSPVRRERRLRSIVGITQFEFREAGGWMPNTTGFATSSSSGSGRALVRLT